MLSFNHVVMDGLQGNIHKIGQQHSMWAAFEEVLKTTCLVEDTLKVTRRRFKDWVETPKRSLKVLEFLTEFEKCFGRLSTRDQTMLLPDKVTMFVRAMDIRDRHDLGMLLEDETMESGLTGEWDYVRNSVAQFTKRKQWLGSEEKKTLELDPIPRAGTKDHQP